MARTNYKVRTIPAGELRFGLNREPPAPRSKFNQTVELERLQAVAAITDAVFRSQRLAHAKFIAGQA